MTVIETLAEWIASLDRYNVPEAQHALARLRILDTLGLIAAGSATEAGRSMALWSGAEVGNGQAIVIPTGNFHTVEKNALVHGTLAHARDFDDTFPDSVVHPGSTVVPVALALAAFNCFGMDETTASIAVGYEIAARLGRAAGRGFHARGFHATSVVGPIAAAATAAYLLGREPDHVADAMALATSMSGGTMAFLADGGWSKWLHTGWSAHGGIVAMNLAINNFRGPRHALDHAQGLYGAFLGHVPTDALAAITEGLGEAWIGDTALFKLYPCAHVIHPFIEAAIESRRSLKPAAKRIRRVVCRIPPWAMPIVAVPREQKIAPRNDLEAIASLPFIVAAAFIDGSVDLKTLEPDTLARRDIQALAARIECEPDPALTVGFDGTMEIERDDGECRTVPAILPPADPERVRAKFRANAKLGGMTRVRKIERALERRTDFLQELMQDAVLRQARQKS